MRKVSNERSNAAKTGLNRLAVFTLAAAIAALGATVATNPAGAKTKLNFIKIEPAKNKKAGNTAKTGESKTKSKVNVQDISITKKN